MFIKNQLRGTIKENQNKNDVIKFSDGLRKNLVRHSNVKVQIML